MARTRAEFDIHGPNDSVDRIVVGPIDFVLAERKYGPLGKTAQNGAIEPNLYLAYTAAKRAGVGKDLDFDAWLQQYEPEAVETEGND